MPDTEGPRKPQKKKPPSTADILKKLKQKKKLQTQSKPQTPKPDTSKPAAKNTAPKSAKPKSKTTAKKEPAKVRPKQPEKRSIPKTIQEKEKDAHPSFLKDTEKEVSIEKQPDTQAIPKKKKRKRFVSSKVIPKINYQRMKDALFKRSFFHLILLFFLTCICAFCIWYVLDEFKQRGAILHNIDLGLTALAEGDEEKAQQIFLQTFNKYKSYHVGIAKNLWFNDGQIEMAVMRMAQGWRDMGNYEYGIRCFKQVCIHDPFLTNPWMKETLRQQMLEFIDPVYWEEGKHEAMYAYLLQDEPSEWEVGEVYLPLMTEWVGMILYPVAERFAKADDVLYGLPIQRNGTRSFKINAKTSYKMVNSTGEVDIALPGNWNQLMNDRLDWYLNFGTNCIFFCRIKDGNYILDGIHGINLSYPYFVDAFDTVVNTYDYEE